MRFLAAVAHEVPMGILNHDDAGVDIVPMATAMPPNDMMLTFKPWK